MAQAHPSSSRDLAASLLLVGATLAALAVANSGWADGYKAALGAQLGGEIGGFVLSDTLKGWIKNSLMAVFFLLVGLEIKAEFREGALATRATAMLPAAAALGGMAMPALVYLAVVAGEPGLARGWAIPAATDIAFAIGVLQMLGRRVPAGLRAFLLAVAVLDDLGAIAVIAVFYTDTLHWGPLALAAGCVAVLAGLARGGVMRLWPYLLVGVVLWLFLLQSGLNATLAGVVVAVFVPLRRPGGGSPLHALAEALKLPVGFVIMPVFAFANAGVSLAGLGLGDLAGPVTLGVLLGLAVGKPVGILAMVWLAVRLGLARLPAGTGWLRLLGAGCIAGIGFTMSLFVGALAFGEGALMEQVKLGVLSGSLLAAVAGAGILLVARRVD